MIDPLDERKPIGGAWTLTSPLRIDGTGHCLT